MYKSEADGLTPDQVKAKIKEARYEILSTQDTIICNLIMENGFTVQGVANCFDMRRFDEKVGKESAYEKAFEKAYELELYLQAQRIHNGETRAKFLGYRSKLILQAEAYEAGDEDGFHLVYGDCACGCQDSAVPYIRTNKGEIEVDETTMIITLKSGKRVILTAEQFDRMLEPAYEFDIL